MKTEERVKAWLDDSAIDEKTKNEIKGMNESELQEAFHRELEFGTGGIRGIMGPGPNRMNEYVVAKVTAALGSLITDEGPKAKSEGVVIAYDVRHKSPEFAKKAAGVLCAMGIRVYLFDDIRTTPMLSFSVRQLQAKAGIMVTASHNPKEYNGYKAYWDDGAQILPEFAEKIENTAAKTVSFSEIKVMSEKEAREAGLLVTPGSELDDEYIEMVKSLSLKDDIDKSISVIYTPLHGTGSKPVKRVLSERGFTNIFTVTEQDTPDPDFTYAPFPNPEDPRAFGMAIEYGRKNNASLLLANDPDCDRTAIMVYDGSEYVYLNGNQTGAIMIKYIMDALADSKKLPENGMIVKTIVTGDLGKVIAADYGVETFEALTGFKNISSVAMQKENEGFRFLFGYEESIGYNAGTFVRDKDGVTSAMLICEAAAYYAQKGLTLFDVLNRLYAQYGFYMENNFSVTLAGMEGSAKIGQIMKMLRETPPQTMSGLEITAFTDYLSGIKTDIMTGEKQASEIPISDVLRFEAGDSLWFAVRPSGTEPKIKIYVYSHDANEAVSRGLVDKAAARLKEMFGA